MLLEEIWTKEHFVDLRFNQLIQYINHQFYNYTHKGMRKETYEYNHEWNTWEFTGIMDDLFYIEDEEYIDFLEMMAGRKNKNE